MAMTTADNSSDNHNGDNHNHGGNDDEGRVEESGSKVMSAGAGLATHLCCKPQVCFSLLSFDYTCTNDYYNLQLHSHLQCHWITAQRET